MHFQRSEWPSASVGAAKASSLKAAQKARVFEAMKTVTGPPVARKLVHTTARERSAGF